jgi:microcystin degradation protein MlrC
MARIAIGGMQHETNCFVPSVTDYSYFCSHRDRPPLSRGEEVLARLPGTSFAISGFLEEMASKHEIIPLLWASGGAGGYVTRDAFERIAAELVSMLSLAMPVDAVYLDLHGAMVTEDFEDGEGELLRRVRAVVGDAIPVVISLDYHANVTLEMVAFSDAMAPYLTYPHVDRIETGRRAAHALATILAKGRPRGRALRKLPFLLPLNHQCTMVDPSKAVVTLSADMEKRGDAITVAYLAGFPPSDLFDCGPSVIVHAYDQEAADRLADELAHAIALLEPSFATPMLQPDEAVKVAMRKAESANRPVIIADTQDNPGCGGSADTTGMLAALHRHGAKGAALGVLCDAEAAVAAHQAGEGSVLSLALGGKSGPAGVVPFEGRFRVARLSNGQFTTTGPCVGGRTVDLGPTALLVIDGISVVVTSKRMQAHDQEVFRHLGLEPSQQKILVLKSTVHFRAHFQPIAEEVLVALAPGGHVVDPTAYDYKKLRAGVRLYPLGPAHRPRHSHQAAL